MPDQKKFYRKLRAEICGFFLAIMLAWLAWGQASERQASAPQTQAPPSASGSSQQEAAGEGARSTQGQQSDAGATKISPQEAEVYLNESYADGAAPLKARG